MLRAMQLRPWALWVAALATTGCWSLEHLTNGVRPADGGATPGDGAGPATRPDSPCATGEHLLCDDFEDGLRVGSAARDWDGVDETFGGKVAISDAFARSGTHALRVTLPRNDALVVMLARLRKQLRFEGASFVRVQLDILLPPMAWAQGDDGQAALVSVAFATSPAFIGWSASMRASTFQIYVATPAEAAGPTQSLPGSNRWFRVAVEWDAARSGSFVTTIDGVVVDDRTLPRVEAGLADGAELSLGLLRFDRNAHVPTPPIEAFIDDVVIDRR